MVVGLAKGRAGRRLSQLRQLAQRQTAHAKHPTPNNADLEAPAIGSPVRRIRSWARTKGRVASCLLGRDRKSRGWRCGWMGGICGRMQAAGESQGGRRHHGGD